MASTWRRISPGGTRFSRDELGAAMRGSFILLRRSSYRVHLVFTVASYSGLLLDTPSRSFFAPTLPKAGKRISSGTTAYLGGESETIRIRSNCDRGSAWNGSHEFRATPETPFGRFQPDRQDTLSRLPRGHCGCRGCHLYFRPRRIRRSGELRALEDFRLRQKHWRPGKDNHHTKSAGPAERAFLHRRRR